MAATSRQVASRPKIVRVCQSGVARKRSRVSHAIYCISLLQPTPTRYLLPVTAPVSRACTALSSSQPAALAAGQRHVSSLPAKTGSNALLSHGGRTGCKKVGRTGPTRCADRSARAVWPNPTANTMMQIQAAEMAFQTCFRISATLPSDSQCHTSADSDLSGARPESQRLTPSSVSMFLDRIHDGFRRWSSRRLQLWYMPS